MDAFENDHAWFTAHPDRRYRLRQQLPDEDTPWPPSPGSGYSLWAIVQRSDHTLKIFAVRLGEEWDDDDDELGEVFARHRAVLH